MFSPNGVVPHDVLARRGRARRSTLKESLKPLEPFKNRTLILHGVCDKRPRRRRQPHARHGLPADGHRALPRQHPGRLGHAGRLGQGASRSTRRSRTTCRSDAGDPHAVRLARVRRDGAGPGRHLDAAWSTPAPNKPIAPIDDPYQMFAKLYGRMKDQESLKSILDDLQDDLKKVALGGQRRGPAAAGRARRRSSARWSRSSSRIAEPGRRARGPRARAGRQARQRQHPPDQQDADRPDGQRFAGRLRPGGDAAVHQFGRRGADEAGSASTRATTSCRTSRTATRSRRRS